MRSLSDDIVENMTTYDKYGDADPPCGIGDSYNANRSCTLTLTAPAYMKAPVLVYYQLDNFHQNYRQYQQSFDPFQLAGHVGTQPTLYATNCSPLNTLGNVTLNPCGLIANTLFNDYFTLLNGTASDGTDLVMIEEGIAWQSDLEYLYAQPEGFRYEECPVGRCDPSCCEDIGASGEAWSCTEPYVDKLGNCYRYYYPDDDTTQYLYETYPDIISPIEGVTNEHFAVWMRVAPLPKFRKLYGWFNQSINAGETLVFRVNANYVVTTFRGSKSLIVTTNNIFGGKNEVLGPTFIGIGAILLLAGVFFLLKHLFRPRKIADKQYLHYKQD